MKVVICLLPLAATGCALFQPRPVIENRFSSRTTISAADPVIRIAVTSGAVPGDDDGTKITALSDRGQAALITATKGKPPAVLKGEKDAPGAIVVSNMLSRRIIVSVRPAEFLSAGDRVDGIRVELKVDNGDRPPLIDLASPTAWTVTSWTQASNGQTVIDIGKLTDVNSATFKASTGVKIGGPLSDTSVEGDLSRTQTREVELKDTTDFDAAVDSNGSAWLDETAGWRVSLAHNLSIDMKLTAPDRQLKEYAYVSVSKLFSEDPDGKTLPKPLLGSQVQLREYKRFAPVQPTSPVCGIATLSWRVRHIINAAARATFSESDDQVQFLTGTDDVHFLLAPAVWQPAYTIEAKGMQLVYRLDGGRALGLRFASLEEASDFRNWLVKARPSGGTLDNVTIGLQSGLGGSKPLTSADYATLVPAVADQTGLTQVQLANATGCAPLPAKR